MEPEPSKPRRVDDPDDVRKALLARYPAFTDLKEPEPPRLADSIFSRRPADPGHRSEAKHADLMPLNLPRHDGEGRLLADREAAGHIAGGSAPDAACLRRRSSDA